MVCGGWGVCEIGWAWLMGWGVNKSKVCSILQKKFLLKNNADKSFENLIIQEGREGGRRQKTALNQLKIGYE